MAWIQPKTDWQDGDYFNLDPDYIRIKGNIEEAHQQSQTFYHPSALIPMRDYSITDDPLPDFFNSIVNNIDQLAKTSFMPVGLAQMGRYKGNQKIWSANDLNTIEKNTELLYNTYKGQENLLPKLAFELGGTEF